MKGHEWFYISLNIASRRGATGLVATTPETQDKIVHLLHQLEMQITEEQHRFHRKSLQACGLRLQ